MRILVVDDEDPVRRMFTEILRHGGYEVFEATNGWQGLSKLEEVACDLLWTDLMMPGLDGIQLAKRVRATRPSIPILLCTAQLPEFIDPRLFDAILAKPVHLEEVLSTVRILLNVTKVQ